MYTPFICDVTSNLKILFLVNPIYYIDSLNNKNSQDSYASRYLAIEGAKKALKCINRHNLKSTYSDYAKEFYYSFIKTGKHNISSLFNIAHTHYYIMEFIKVLKNNTKDKKATKLAMMVDRFDSDLDKYYNVSSNFLKEKPELLESSKTSTIMNFSDSPRFKEWLFLRELTDSLNLDVTFILMPYNKIYFERIGNTKIVAEFEKANILVSETLCTQPAKCINMTQTSDKLGWFYDSMHYSDYGAYNTYEIINKTL